LQRSIQKANETVIDLREDLSFIPLPARVNATEDQANAEKARTLVKKIVEIEASIAALSTALLDAQRLQEQQNKEERKRLEDALRPPRPRPEPVAPEKVEEESRRIIAKLIKALPKKKHKCRPLDAFAPPRDDEFHIQLFCDET
jgi:hypothetical protein